MSNIYELEEVLELAESEQNGFSINDDATADWALRKIAEERAELERLKGIAEQQIEEINQKISYLEKATERRTNFLKGCLGQYFQTVPHKSTKTQETYKLLSGSLVLKLPKQTMVKDDAQLLEYFHQNNMAEYIKTEEKPAWGEYKKNLSIVDGTVMDTVTGEIVNVIRVEETPGVFEVKTS